MRHGIRYEILYHLWHFLRWNICEKLGRAMNNIIEKEQEDADQI